MTEFYLLPDDGWQWFAMRDIKRPNDPNRAYKVLAEKGFDVFTPIERKMVKQFGRYVRVEKVLFPDLLFVHTHKFLLDKEVEQIPTLRYRLQRCDARSEKDRIIIIDEASMRNFRLACDAR